MNRLGRARNARINQAIRHANDLLVILKRFQGYEMTKHVEDKDGWFDMRTDLESLVQCCHEANAYNNAVAPKGGEADRAHPTERVKPRSVRDRISAGEEPAHGATQPE